MVSMPERGRLKHTCAAVLFLQDVGIQSSVSISNRECPSSSCARKSTSKVKVGLDWGRTWCSNEIKFDMGRLPEVGHRFFHLSSSVRSVALTNIFLRLRPGDFGVSNVTGRVLFTSWCAAAFHTSHSEKIKQNTIERHRLRLRRWSGAAHTHRIVRHSTPGSSSLHGSCHRMGPPYH